MDSEQLPSSIEEVEALIKELYGMRTTQNVRNVQEVLHKLQLSPQGWQLADALLNRKDPQVRFFAALTFIVKLNTDAKSLTECDAQSLLLTLIESLIQSIENGEGPLVIRKLCSALVAYFLQYSSSWSNCVKHLIFCFCSGKALPYSTMYESLDPGTLIDAISEKKAETVFWFGTMLVEDVSKMDSNSMKANDFHQRIRPNVDYIVPLIGKYLFHGPNQEMIKVQQAAMKCLQSWVSLSHRSFIDREADLEALRLLTQPALRCITDDELYEITIELFIDILSSYSRFLSSKDFESLHSLFNTPWAQKKYEILVQGNYEWESIQFGSLLLAFGDAMLKELTENIDDPLCAHYLALLLGLLSAKGYAVAEDKIYVLALEFWNTFVEAMVDASFSTEPGSSPRWFPTAQRHVMIAIENCWLKSQLPSIEEFNTWDSVDGTGFKDARRDFSDMIQQFYLISGPALLELWIKKISCSIAARSWSELEVSLYCLAQLSDSIAETPNRNHILDQVFTPEIVGIFSDPQLEIFTKTRRSFLNILYGYADYFSERPVLLPNVLNISFMALSSPSLVGQASRSIMKLCSDCRQNLLPNLSEFLQNYSSIARNVVLDGDTKELVIEGITCLIQELSDEALKIAPLNQLLSYIESDVELCLSVLSKQAPLTGIDDPCTFTAEKEARAADIGIVALKCLLGIAKGLQATGDQPIDLDYEEDRTNSAWNREDGLRVQQRICNIICQVFNALGHRGEIVDECCLLWRQGLRQLELGPFVLPPSLVAGLMMKATLQTPRLGLLIKTAACLTCSKYTPELHEVFTPLITWVANLLRDLGDPGADPEVSHAGIEFMQRLLPKNINVLLIHQPPSSLEHLFMFALEALKGTEPLPKQAAAEFWSLFIFLNSSPSEIQSHFDSALQILGPLLAKALIFNIGGKAARSELDKLSGPIKKLTIFQASAKFWFEAALLDPAFPSDRVDRKDKALFLQKIMSLRGARPTNQVVRDFWLTCRGTNFAYAS